MKPTTIGDLKRILEETEKAWTSQDLEYLGKFDDQLLLVWIPRSGYAPAYINHVVEFGGFLVTGLDQEFKELL